MRPLVQSLPTSIDCALRASTRLTAACDVLAGYKKRRFSGATIIWTRNRPKLIYFLEVHPWQPLKPPAARRLAYTKVRL